MFINTNIKHESDNVCYIQAKDVTHLERCLIAATNDILKTITIEECEALHSIINALKFYCSINDNEIQDILDTLSFDTRKKFEALIDVINENYNADVCHLIHAACDAVCLYHDDNDCKLTTDIIRIV